MNITNLFFKAAETYPTKPAIIEIKQDISFAELAKQVKFTAAYFKRAGICKGDRVMVFVPMSINLYRIVLALFHIGAVAVFLDEWASLERLRVACRLADCRGFIGTRKSRMLAFFFPELRRIPIKLSLNTRLKEDLRPLNVEANHSALITFTTGSTGIPKAADRSHGFLAAQFKALIKEVDPQTEDVDMPVLPIVLFLNLGIGCTSVIADFNARKVQTIAPEKIFQQIKKHQVNRITASPFFVKSLSEYCLSHPTHLPSLKKLITGGAPVFPSEAALYLKAFDSLDVQIVYGSTEAEPISSISAKELCTQYAQLDFGLAVGAPFEDINLKIIAIDETAIPTLNPEEFEEKVLPDGQIGEIVVSGDHVLKRYFRNEAAFQLNKIRVDETIWHRTGDSGRLVDGNMFLTGRCKELISTDQGYLSSFLVESQLNAISGVTMGTLLKVDQQAVLVLESHLNATQLQDQLGPFEFDQLIIRSKIPRDPRHNSKIDYGKLREQIRSR